MGAFSFLSFFNRSAEKDHSFYENLPEDQYPEHLKIIYRNRMGKSLNLKNPKRFTEKIQWLKLYDNSEIKKTLTDKITVRDWVTDKIGEKYLRKVYGVWENFDDIIFDEIPDEFVIKTNHACKMQYKIFDKQAFLSKGKEEVRKQFEGWLSYNFAFCAGFELQYKGIQPKILIEEMLKNSDNEPLMEYFVLCFNGEPKIINAVRFNNGVESSFYDLEWNFLPFTDDKKKRITELPKPYNLEEIIELSKVLSKDFKLVRVDFMEVNKKVYFAEMTFTPTSGLCLFHPDKYDKILGKMLSVN